MHRVIIPDDDITRSSRRQTSAVFIHPDADTLIECTCVDGSSKYQSVLAGDDTRRKLSMYTDIYWISYFFSIIMTIIIASYVPLGKNTNYKN